MYESSPEGKTTMEDWPRGNPKRRAMSWASSGCDVPFQVGESCERELGVVHVVMSLPEKILSCDCELAMAARDEREATS